MLLQSDKRFIAGSELNNMESVSGNSATIAAPARVSLPATLVVALGIASAWIAAGSSGLLAHSLRHVLTCLSLGTCIVTGWPFFKEETKLPSPVRRGAGGEGLREKKWQDWILFGGGIVIAFIFAVLPLETVNVLAVVIILSTLAHFHRGVDSKAMLLAALAVFCFAVVHFLFRSYPPCWIIENQLGQALGWLAAKMIGQQLSTGATFGGGDFLLLMGFLYSLWLYNSKPPRTHRALCAGAAIIIAQFTYLATLAFSEKILTQIPPIYPLEDDYMRVGATVWQNSLRAMIPWNLPILAVVLQSLVAAVMLRFTAWQVYPSPISQNLPPKGLNSPPTNIIPEKSAEPNIYFKIAPALAAMLLAGLTSFWTIKPDLNGKTILAYRSAEVAWTSPKQGQLAENGFGLLADYVRSLGGKFLLSNNLSSEELAKTDVVLLLKPDGKFSTDQKTRLHEFLARGGSLLIASDRTATAGTRLKIEDVLESSGIRFTGDIAQGKTDVWEQSLQVLNHPATLGTNDFRNDFGLEACTDLRVQSPAYPLLIGRWGGNQSSRASADRLGDLVLIAESYRSNGGKIIVLADTACLSNDMLPVSYEFMGRLLGYLAQKTPAISLWRTVGVLLFAVLLMLLIVVMQKASQTAIASIAFAAALVLCGICTIDSQRITPSDAEKLPRRLALIDSSHLEAYSDSLWHPLPTVKEFSSTDWADQGLGHFTRTLQSNGYLPLRLKELTPAWLERGSLLILNAPGRRYSLEEMKDIQKFAENGGTLLCIAGGEESRVINPLLKRFNLKIPHSPVPPHEKYWEPTPDGAQMISYTKPDDNKQDKVHFYAAWDIISLARGAEGDEALPQIYFTENNRERWIIVMQNVGGNGGRIAVISDTYFAANENPDSSFNARDENERFWKWFLPQIAGPADSPKKNNPLKTPGDAQSDSESPKDSEPDEG